MSNMIPFILMIQSHLCHLTVTIIVLLSFKLVWSIQNQLTAAVRHSHTVATMTTSAPSRARSSSHKGSDEDATISSSLELTSDNSPATAHSDTDFAFYLLHAQMVFYAFFWSVWLSQPVLPYLSKELGADNVMFGYFSSFNQFVQLVGAPLIGRVIDVRGAKLALLVSHTVAALSYGLLWQATSVPLLFASQIPTMFMAAMHSTQAYITLISSAESRAKQLGRVSLSYGVGFVLGPIVGGTLSKYIAYNEIALIGSIGSACVCSGIFFLLPNVQPHVVVPSPTTTTDVASSSSPKSKSAVTRLLESPSIRTIILVKFLVGTALAVYRTSFSLVAKDYFGLDAQQNGFILSGVGGLTMVVNIVVIGWLTARWTDRFIVTRCIIVVGVCFILSAFAAVSLTALLVYLVPMTIAGAISATILTSVLTKSSSLADAGSVLGLDMGIGTAARVIAPTLGGWLLVSGSYEMVGGVAAALTIGAFVVDQFSHPWDGTIGTTGSTAASPSLTKHDENDDKEMERWPLKKEL